MRLTLACLAAAAGLLSAPARADLAGQVVRVELAAGSLRGTLQQLVDQTGWQVVYDPRDVAGRRGAAVQGHMTFRQALQRALAASSLVPEFEEFAERAYVCPRPDVLPRQRHVLYRGAPLTPADTPGYKPVANTARRLGPGR